MRVVYFQHMAVNEIVVSDKTFGFSVWLCGNSGSWAVSMISVNDGNMLLDVSITGSILAYGECSGNLRYRSPP